MEHNEDSSKEEHTEPEQSPLLGTDEGNNGLTELIGIEEAQRISPDARKNTHSATLRQFHISTYSKHQPHVPAHHF
ncbi:MAG: hypothetical protein F4X57_11770 [Chloroflexi bacterium]|nr:hypothetical protein [Chloroflexota bacterium]